jgi:hypothetical protein
LRPAEAAAPDRPLPRRQRDQLGPFKRPRNAMMAAEERLLLLQRQYGERIAFDAGVSNP